jgi:hypothetical protein
MCVVGPHRERFGLQHGPYSALAGPSTDFVGCDAPEPLPRRRSHQSFHRPCQSPCSGDWRAAPAACERTLSLLVKGSFSTYRKRIRLLIEGR